MFRFPWSNFHELNLDWILEVVKEAKEIFVNGRSDIDNAVETANEALEVAEQAAAAVIVDGSITIPKLNNEVLKTTAYVIVGNRADEAVPAGAYVYLRNSLVSGLADGIYTAAANIPAGAIVTPTEFQQSTALRDSGALNVLKNTLNRLESEIGIIVDGKSCVLGASQGQYVILKNSTISGLSDGLYTAAQAIPAGEQNVTLSMLTGPISVGGLNSLKNSFNISTYISGGTGTNWNAYRIGGIICVTFAEASMTKTENAWNTIFTLPEGWRPSKAIRFVGFDNNSTDAATSFLACTVSTNGNVSFYGLTGLGSSIQPNGSVVFML